MVRKKTSRKKFFYLFFLFAVFTAFLTFYGHAFRYIVIGAVKPFISMKDLSVNLVSGVFDKFENSGELSKENHFLSERVRELEARVKIMQDFPGKHDPVRNSITAQVINVPPSAPFDGVLINRGENDGIKKEMKVVLAGGIFVGYVEEVFPNYSRVRLLSSFDDMAQVFLGKTTSMIMARGMGAGMISFELPRDFPINEGDGFFVFSDQPLLAGFIERIKQSDSSPIIDATGVLPFNLNNIGEVYLVP